MVDGLKSFFRELLDPNPIKEKHVNLTVEQLEELQKILENAYEYKHARIPVISKGGWIYVNNQRIFTE